MSDASTSELYALDWERPWRLPCRRSCDDLVPGIDAHRSERARAGGPVRRVGAWREDGARRTGSLPDRVHDPRRRRPPL